MDYFTLAPRELMFKINALLPSLVETTRKEVGVALVSVINNNPKLHIYSLGLYYSAGSWSYMYPTYASEEGLKHVAEHYGTHSPGTLEEEKISLRWSPCDSPHHDEEDLERMMPESDKVLFELKQLLDNASPDYGEVSWPESVMEDHDLFYRFISAVHQRIKDTVTEAMLSATRDNKELAGFFATTSCALTLNAGDISNEDFLENIKPLNRPETYQRVRREIAEAEKIQLVLHEKWDQKIEDELANPPTTNLTIDDFRSIVDNFKPQFIEVNGGIYLDRDYEWPLLGTSENEDSSNRIRLMALIEDSPHYDEIEKLYGHFTGKQFEPDDLLPTICRALVKRLGEALIKQFKDRSFRVFMAVDRNSLYRITFTTKRQDDFEFFMVSGIFGGVEEIHEFSANGNLLSDVARGG